MPKCCDECFALDDNGDYPTCIITHTSRGYNFRVREKRMDDCPLSPLKFCPVWTVVKEEANQ